MIPRRVRRYCACGGRLALRSTDPAMVNIALANWPWLHEYGRAHYPVRFRSWLARRARHPFRRQGASG